MAERFVAQPLKPVAGSMDAGRTAPGAPVLPRQFTWRGGTFTVSALLDSWKDTGPCGHGSGERYVRRHWYHVRTTDGDEMKIYFERRARSGREVKRRWWLYTTTCPEGE